MFVVTGFGVGYDQVIEPRHEQDIHQIGEEEHCNDRDSPVSSFLSVALAPVPPTINVLVDEVKSASASGQDKRAVGYPGPDADLLLRRISAGKGALRLVALLERGLFRVLVRSESDAIICLIMDGIVVHVGWKAHDEERLLSLTK